MEYLICPSCKKNSLRVEFFERKIPYFGKECFLRFFCESCSYVAYEVIPLEKKNPIKITFKVENKEDLNVIVARYKFARVEIPEIGLELEPGYDPQDFITTVEGLLNRFLMAISVLEKDESINMDKLKEVKEKIMLAKKGSLKFTIIIEDKYGLSKIDSNKSIVEEIKE